MYYALSMEQFYPNPLIAPFLAFHCMRVNVVTAVVVVVVTCHTHPEWRGQSCRRPPPGSTGQCGDTGAGRGEAEYRGQQAKQAGDHQVQDKQVPGVPVSPLPCKHELCRRSKVATVSISSKKLNLIIRGTGMVL